MYKRRIQSALTVAQNIRLSVLLALCLVFGGTSQNILTPKLVLYALSIIFIGWALSQQKKDGPRKFWRLPILILAAFFALHIVYIIPLPSGVWSVLPGRSAVVEGFGYLDAPLPWLPLSLTPEQSQFALYDFLPPIAIIIITLLAASSREIKYGIYTLIISCLVVALLGMLQVSGLSKAFYFYSITNIGRGVGFFSNANHQATLLVMLLPIALYLAFRRSEFVTTNSALSGKNMLGVFATIFCVTGTVLTGSIAGYGLVALAFFASLFVLGSRTPLARRVSLGVAILFLAFIGLDFLILDQSLSDVMSKFSTTSNLSRTEITSKSWAATKDFGIFGSGPGSFETIYRLYEDKTLITRNYIPQAHNDFLQLILEFGTLGWLLIISFLIWFFKTGFDIFRNHEQLRKTVFLFWLSLLCLLIHSLVDYPMRTIAISSVFVFFVSLILIGTDENDGRLPQI